MDEKGDPDPRDPPPPGSALDLGRRNVYPLLLLFPLYLSRALEGL